MSRMFEQLEGRQLLSAAAPTVTGVYTGTFTDHKGVVDTVTLDIASQTASHIFGTVKVTTPGGKSRTFDILGKVTADDKLQFHALHTAKGHYLKEHGTINAGLTEIIGTYSVDAKDLGTHGGTVKLNKTVTPTA